MLHILSQAASGQTHVQENNNYNKNKVLETFTVFSDLWITSASALF